MIRTTFSKLLVFVAVCGIAAMPAATWARGGGGHGGGGHGGGGGHVGGGGGGGHFGGGGGGHISGGHVGGGSFGGGHVASPHIGSAPSSGFRGNVGGGISHGATGGARIGAAPSATFRGNMGSGAGIRSGGFSANHSAMAPRIGGATAGRTGNSFLSNHFSTNHGAASGNLRTAAGNFGGRSTLSATPASASSFASRHFNGGGIGGTSLSNRSGFTSGFGGSRGTTVVNNYNYGSRYGGYGYGGRRYGYGFGFGYPYLGFGFGYPYGYGYGGGLLGSLLYGLGGYGYGGWGYGGYGYSGYGLGNYSYNPYSTWSTPYVAAYSPTYATSAMPTTGSFVSTSPTPATSTAAATTSENFAESGEAAFKAGDYKGAAYAWRHAALDDPQNPVLLMMLGQALFATGSYNEAAGVTQAAMQALPKDQWGVVSGNYKELYGSVQDYTNQLRALEKAVVDKPDEPAQRFLLGFHYGYLGYPQQSIKQLDKVLTLAPKDEVAKKLRDEMQTKLPKPTTPAVAPMPEIP